MHYTSTGEHDYCVYTCPSISVEVGEQLCGVISFLPHLVCFHESNHPICMPGTFTALSHLVAPVVNPAMAASSWTVKPLFFNYTKLLFRSREELAKHPDSGMKQTRTYIPAFEETDST